MGDAPVKKEVRVSLVQFASTWLDRKVNARRMAEFVEQEARAHNADLVVFPELASTGYLEPHTDIAFSTKLYGQSERIPGPTTHLLSEVAKQYNVHVVVGISRLHPVVPMVLYNSAAFISPTGEIIGVHDKVHSCLGEKNYYIAGSTVDVFETDLGKVAMNICYDVRFPELARVQALRGAEIIVSIWASFLQPGKVPSDSIIQRCATRAMENGVYFLGCNRSGAENDRVFYGRSAIAGPSGDTIAKSTTGEEEVVRGTLTDADLKAQRIYLTLFRDRRPELYGDIVAGI
jgi:predicted amidohydrolase